MLHKRKHITHSGQVSAFGLLCIGVLDIIMKRTPAKAEICTFSRSKERKNIKKTRR